MGKKPSYEDLERRLASREAEIDALTQENGRLRLRSDITRQKQLEEELQGKQQLFDAILANVPICVSRLDSDGTHTLSLGSGLKRLGLKDNQIVGVNVHERYPHVGDHFRKAREAGIAEFVDEGAIDGEPWCFQTWLLCDKGSTDGYYSISFDITERKELIDELQDARADVKTLTGLLPICAVCKKVRDDVGSWHDLEVYVKDRSDVDFSHSYCPECYNKAVEAIHPDAPDAT